MTSIKQNRHPISLPNFCNMGVNLRILVLAEMMGIAAALLKSKAAADLWRELLNLSGVMQPMLLVGIVMLCLANRLLARLSYPAGVASVLALGLLAVSFVYSFLQRIYLDYEMGALPRYWLFSLGMTGSMLAYFNLRSRALSPAVTEARLQALQARIRPHFLFNSINAVLSLIRSDPKRAERALEDMADLFRVLMADNRQLSTLSREVSLCWQYLELEQLRLGERLKILWHVEKMPKDALVPPLILQPLVENAVYHGIEPSSEPGEISINIFRKRDKVHLVIRNPFHAEARPHIGNKMALQNIQERLSLHFDAEASVDCQMAANSYQVHIIIPYMPAPK